MTEAAADKGRHALATGLGAGGGFTALAVVLTDGGDPQGRQATYILCICPSCIPLLHPISPVELLREGSSVV